MKLYVSASILEVYWWNLSLEYQFMDKEIFYQKLVWKGKMVILEIWWDKLMAYTGIDEVYVPGINSKLFMWNSSKFWKIGNFPRATWPLVG